MLKDQALYFLLFGAASDAHRLLRTMDFAEAEEVLSHALSGAAAQDYDDSVEAAETEYGACTQIMYRGIGTALRHTRERNYGQACRELVAAQQAAEDAFIDWPENHARG